MSAIELGRPVPDFEAAATGDKTLKLSDLRGRKVIIYFYPKDSTPGCTTEGQTFRDLYADFQAADTEIFGVSRDSLASHEKFKAKHAFPFDLLSDSDETLCKLFDVIHEKNLYGRKSMGIVRSTFIIDREGNLAAEFRKIKLKGHVEEMLETVQSMD
ncbi:MAG: peroxiredoxin [Gammaproteobacteria bacterium]|nr:peroxiredoxin [Gammaproteobacteria bacterium]